MSTFGVANAVASMMVGKVSDLLGRMPVLIFGCVLHVVGLIVLVSLDSVNRLEILIPVAVLFGVGDAVFNTQIYGILGYIFTGSSEAAFASFKFYQSASTGILFFRKPSSTSLPFPLPFPPLPHAIPRWPKKQKQNNGG